jgi:hypothetical protein
MTQVTCKQKPYVSTELMQMNTNINLITKHSLVQPSYVPTEQPPLVSEVGANSLVDREVSCSQYIYISKFAINVVDDILDSKVQNGIGKKSRNTKLQKCSSENRKWQSTALTNVLLNMLLFSTELLQKVGYCCQEQGHNKN